jgi:hypothetical protein
MCRLVLHPRTESSPRVPLFLTPQRHLRLPLSLLSQSSKVQGRTQQNVLVCGSCSIRLQHQEEPEQVSSNVVLDCEGLRMQFRCVALD